MDDFVEVWCFASPFFNPNPVFLSVSLSACVCLCEVVQINSESCQAKDGLKIKYIQFHYTEKDLLLGVSTVLLKLHQTAAADEQETSSSVVKQLTRTWTDSTRTEEAAWKCVKENSTICQLGCSCQIFANKTNHHDNNLLISSVVQML